MSYKHVRKVSARHECQMRFLYFLHEPDMMHGPNSSLKGGRSFF